MSRKPSSWVFDIVLAFSDLIPAVVGVGTVVLLVCNMHKITPFIHQFVQHR